MTCVHPKRMKTSHGIACLFTAEPAEDAEDTQQLREPLTRSCLMNPTVIQGASEYGARLRAGGATARSRRSFQRRRKRATRPERAGGAAREIACRGVRGAKPRG
jgi:hypothetical protein